jgi:hypothetical protein
VVSVGVDQAREYNWIKLVRSDTGFWLNRIFVNGTTFDDSPHSWGTYALEGADAAVRASRDSQIDARP